MPENKKRKRDKLRELIPFRSQKNPSTLHLAPSIDNGEPSADNKPALRPSISRSDVSVSQNLSQDGSNLPTTSSQPETEDPQKSASDLSTSQRLWNKAYENLLDEEDTAKLIKAYMQTLEKVLSGKEESNTDVSANLDDPTARQEHMRMLLEEGQKKVASARKVANGISNVSDFILSAKDAVDLAVQNIPQAALPWAGVCVGLEILARPGEATKSNIAGIAHVTSKMDWYCALSEHLFDTNNTIDKVDLTSIRQKLESRVVSLYEALLLYQVKTICSYYRHQGVVFLRDLFNLDDWDGDLENVKNAEADVEKESSQIFQEHTKLALSTLANTANDMVNQLGDLTQTVQGFVDSQKKAERDAEETACRRDLYLVDPHHDMNRIEDSKDELFNGAYEWILDTKEYKDFTNWNDDESSSSSRLLWINGLAGTGKTMLMIGIIRNLSGQLAAIAPRISFFFCQGTNAALKEPTAVLRSLIWLLLVQEPSLISHLLQKHKERPRLFTDENAFVALSEVFENILRDSRLPCIYLAVDALDELDESDNLRTNLIKLIAKSLTFSQNIKWLVSSRPEIVPDSPIRPDAFVELNTDNLKQPVAAYIEHKASSLVGKRGYDKDVIKEIKQEITERANDTFLWAALVFKALDQVKGWDAVNTVKEIPAQLSDLYGHMLDRIWKHSDKDQERCKKVLIACFLAYRPLTLDELPIVADLVDGQPAKTSNMKDLTIDIINKCSSFLRLADRAVNLVHQSALEYFRGLDTPKLRLGPDGVTKGHLDISRRSIRAMMCLLQRNPWKLPNDSRSQHEPPPDEDPLAPIRYSCVYWTVHLCTQECRNSNETELSDGGPVHRFLEARFLRWLESLALLGKIPDGLRAIKNVLDVVSSRPDSFPQLMSFLRDAEKFFLAHAEMIKQMPVQTYLSVLVFSPTMSLVRTCQWEERLENITPVTGIVENWPQYIWRQFIGSSRMAISADSKLLAIASASFVKILDLETGLFIQQFNHRDKIGIYWGDNGISFLPDGKEIVIFGSRLSFWNLATGILSEIPLDLDKRSDDKIRLSPNGKILASIRTIRNFDMKTGTSLHTSTTIVRIFDTKTGASLQVLEIERAFKVSDSIVFSPDGMILAVVLAADLGAGSFGEITLWDVETGKIRHNFQCPIPMPLWGDDFHVIISPDGKLLACPCTSDDTLIQLWSTATGTRQHDLKYPGELKASAFSPDGKTLMAVSNHEKCQFVLIWDLAADTVNLQVEIENKHRYIQNIRFSPDNRFLLIEMYDSSTELWNVANIIHGLSVGSNRKERVKYVALSPDAVLLAATSDTIMRLWDANTGECLQTWDVHEVHHPDFSPDSTTIVAFFTNEENKIGVGFWNAATGTCQRTLEIQEIENSGYRKRGGMDLKYSPDGKALAIVFQNGDSHNICLWDLNTGMRQRMWTGVNVYRVFAFSPDGKLFALCEKKDISLWDIGTDTRLQTLEFEGQATILLFSPDGKTVATGTYRRGRKVYFWDVDTGREVLVVPLNYAPWDITFAQDLRVNGKIVESPSRFSASKGRLSISRDTNFVFRDDVPLLYIPPQYKFLRSAVRGDKIVIFKYGGDMIILRFEAS